MSAFIERIRAETRPLHDALERESPLGRGDVTADDYRCYLEKLLGFHAPLEAEMGALIERYQLTAEFEGRQKTPLMACDLAALGAPPFDTVPWSPWLPRLGGLGALLGCAYVLEGATLGGKVLLRRLGPRLPRLAEASRYLDCYGDRAGERWRAMLGLLDARVVEPAEQDAAVGAACDSFRSLARWLAYAAPAPVLV